MSCGPNPNDTSTSTPSLDPSKFGKSITETLSSQLSTNQISTENLAGIWLKETSEISKKTPFILFASKNFDALEQYTKITEPQIKSDLTTNGYMLWENAHPLEFGIYEVVYSKFLLFYPKWDVKGVNVAIKDPPTKCAYFSYTNSQLTITKIENTTEKIDSNTSESDIKSKCKAIESDRSHILSFYFKPKS